MILIRLRRSLPAIVASTVLPASSSIENIPALNFSTTLPSTSIASSLGKLFQPFLNLIGSLSREFLAIVSAFRFRAGCVHGQGSASELGAAESSDGEIR